MRSKKIVALAAAAVITASVTATTASAYDVWISANGHFFNTEALARADGGSAIKVDSANLTASQIASINTYSYYPKYSTSGYHWYSRVTGQYYLSQTEALAASGNKSSNVVYVPYSGYRTSSYYDRYYPYYYYDYYYDYYYPYSNYYYNYYNYPYNYYYGINGYGYYNYYGVDLNYYNYNAFKNRVGDGNSSTSSSVAVGTPFVNGRTTYAGWDKIVSFLKGSKIGSSVTINLNGAATVPASVLAEIGGKDIGVKFIQGNGSVWSINGLNVTSAKAFNPTIEYNINYIPSKLKNKAKDGSIASYQLGIGGGFDILGHTATVSVKVNTIRAGKTAFIYRYDGASDSLQAVSQCVVASDGTCTFNVSDGGAYLIILK